MPAQFAKVLVQRHVAPELVPLRIELGRSVHEVAELTVDVFQIWQSVQVAAQLVVHWLWFCGIPRHRKTMDGALQQELKNVAKRSTQSRCASTSK